MPKITGSAGGDKLLKKSESLTELQKFEFPPESSTSNVEDWLQFRRVRNNLINPLLLTPSSGTCSYSSYDSIEENMAGAL